MEKMIHFDFMVSFEDAENIMGALQDEIGKMHQDIIKRMVSLGTNAKYDEDPEIIWLNARIEYIKALKMRMNNTCVEVDD